MPKRVVRNYDERIMRFRILSHTGEKIQIKLPVDFVKKMIENNAIDILNGADDIVDGEKLLNLMSEAFKYDLTGEIVYLERQNGDVIRVIIE